MEKSLGYSDVYLVPRHSNLRSRTEADISVEFLGRKFKAPWLPSNMKSVIDEKIAHWLSENDYFYIYHRFDMPPTRYFVENANRQEWKTISISVGVKNEDKELLQRFVKKGLRVDFVTIDVAHGDSILVKEMISYIKNLYLFCPITPKIIAGNIATPEAVRNLTEWGADAVKVGIAGGAACSTKHQTGFHVPMFSCIKNICNDSVREFTIIGCSKPYQTIKVEGAKIPIIADGGIRENGDVSKALAAGATMVMAGSLFAACIDAPGESVYSYKEEFSSCVNGPHRIVKDKVIFKKYHGSASHKEKGSNFFIEGKEIEIRCNGMTFQEKIQELKESLQSSISYGGGFDLTTFKKVCYITTK